MGISILASFYHCALVVVKRLGCRCFWYWLVDLMRMGWQLWCGFVTMVWGGLVGACEFDSKVAWIESECCFQAVQGSSARLVWVRGLRTVQRYMIDCSPSISYVRAFSFILLFQHFLLLVFLFFLRSLCVVLILAYYGASVRYKGIGGGFHIFLPS